MTAANVVALACHGAWSLQDEEGKELGPLQPMDAAGQLISQNKLPQWSIHTCLLVES